MEHKITFSLMLSVLISSICLHTSQQAPRGVAVSESAQFIQIGGIKSEADEKLVKKSARSLTINIITNEESVDQAAAVSLPRPNVGMKALLAPPSDMMKSILVAQRPVVPLTLEQARQIHLDVYQGISQDQ